MPRIEIYTKDWCGYCASAKALLNARGLSYRESDVTHDVEREIEMRHRSGRQSVPQIFVDDEHVGGFDDLRAYVKQGHLSPTDADQQPAIV